MPLDEIERRTLWISVWHSDMFGRNDFLGEVMLPMAGQIVAEDSSPKWYSLQERVCIIKRSTVVYKQMYVNDNLLLNQLIAFE